MKAKKPAPPVLRDDRTPEESLSKMKDFTRRLIQVPKSEAVKVRKRRQS